MDIYLLTSESRTTTAIDISESGAFNNVIDGQLKMEKNGEFIATFKVRNGTITPTTGDCVGIQAPGYDRIQKFVIKRTKELLNGTVEVYAEHISYDLLTIPLSPLLTAEATSTLGILAQTILDHALSTHNFTIGDSPSIAGNQTMYLDPQHFSNLREAFGGKEGSLLDNFPGTIFRFDNEIINVYTDFGNEIGAAIYKGHNILEMGKEEDILNQYDAIFPYAKVEDSDGNVETVYMDYTTTGIRGIIYPQPVDNTFAGLRIKTVDLSDRFDDLPTSDQLQIAAIAYFNSSDLTAIQRKLECRIVDLSQAIGGENEQEINLYDKIDLNFGEDTYTLPVTSIVVNLLNGRRDNIYVNRTILERG